MFAFSKFGVRGYYNTDLERDNLQGVAIHNIHEWIKILINKITELC